MLAEILIGIIAGLVMNALGRFDEHTVMAINFPNIMFLIMMYTLPLLVAYLVSSVGEFRPISFIF
jgi:uncharacterized protein YacL